jgi:hypothetical protein
VVQPRDGATRFPLTEGAILGLRCGHGTRVDEWNRRRNSSMISRARAGEWVQGGRGADDPQR